MSHHARRRLIATMGSGSVPLLLDLYPAALAYSLRNLTSAWVGLPVVQVRRSSDNALSDFTAAQVLDGTLAAWVGAGDGFVRTWYDQSGGGRNATQTVANTQQPRIVSGGVLDVGETGLPCVRFIDNTSGLLHNLRSAPYYNTNVPVISAFSVYQKNTVGSFTMLEAAHDGAFFSTDRAFRLYHNGNGCVSYTRRGGSVRTLGGYTMALGQMVIRHDVVDRVNITQYIDGSVTPDFTAVDVNMDFVSFNSVWWGNENNGQRQGDQSISEIIRYNQDVSSFRADVQNDINNYYEIY